MSHRHWFLLAVSIAAPTRAVAQIRLEIGPLVGYLRPYGSFETASVYSTALPVAPEALKGRALGGESRLWFGRRTGAELRASEARSTIPSVSTPEGPSPTTPAKVATLTAQALFTITGTPMRHQVWVSAGLGVAHHGGKAYQRYTSLTDIGAVVGAGARLGLTRSLHLIGGLSALTYMFDMPMSPELRLNPGSLERGRQLDVLVHIGITWMLVRG